MCVVAFGPVRQSECPGWRGFPQAARLRRISHRLDGGNSSQSTYFRAAAIHLKIGNFLSKEWGDPQMIAIRTTTLVIWEILTPSSITSMTWTEFVPVWLKMGVSVDRQSCPDEIVRADLLNHAVDPRARFKGRATLSGSTFFEDNAPYLSTVIYVRENGSAVGDRAWPHSSQVEPTVGLERSSGTSN